MTIAGCTGNRLGHKVEQVELEENPIVMKGPAVVWGWKNLMPSQWIAKSIRHLLEAVDWLSVALAEIFAMKASEQE